MAHMAADWPRFFTTQWFAAGYSFDQRALHWCEAGESSLKKSRWWQVCWGATATVEDPKPLEDFLAATQAHAQERYERDPTMKNQNCSLLSAHVSQIFTIFHNLSQLINIHKLRSFVLVAAVFIAISRLQEMAKGAGADGRGDTFGALARLVAEIFRHHPSPAKCAHVKQQRSVLQYFPMAWLIDGIGFDGTTLYNISFCCSNSFPSFWKLKDLICQIRQRLQSGVLRPLGLLSSQCI